VHPAQRTQRELRPRRGKEGVRMVSSRAEENGFQHEAHLPLYHTFSCDVNAVHGFSTRLS